MNNRREIAIGVALTAVGFLSILGVLFLLGALQMVLT